MSRFNMKLLKLTLGNISIIAFLSLHRRDINTLGFSPNPTFRIRTRTMPTAHGARDINIRVRPTKSKGTSIHLRSSFLEESSTFTKENKSTSQNATDSEEITEFPFDVEINDPSHGSVQLRSDKYGPNEEVSIEKISSLSKQDENKENDQNRIVEFVGLGTWIAGLSTFLLVNNYVGPWPGEWLQNTPVQYFGLAHALAAMLFGGGVILTTFIEWLAVSSKNTSVLNFWFGKVPALDSLVVLPALTASIVSGVGLSVDHYNSLGEAPVHVVSAISTLLAFAVWWATTDLTTQGAASEAIEEWTKSGGKTEVPRIVQLRKISNVVSCIFVAAIYAIMVLKPGYTPP